jgi:predicted transcriptional regulator
MTPEQYRARWQLGHDYPMVAPNYAKARYDWTQLFIGSEGTLGVITQVVIGLQPKPQGLQTAVRIRKSVTPDCIVCLEDGNKFKSLKRHLRTQPRRTAEPGCHCPEGSGTFENVFVPATAGFLET